MLHLDGSTLEGGGQLVRNALALSVLTAQPIRISHIRGNRSGKRGLKRSHSAAIGFLLEVCGGTASGNQVGSSELTFYPRGDQQRELVRNDEMLRDRGIKWNKKKDKGKQTDLREEMEGKIISSVKGFGLNSTGISSRPVKTEYTIRLSTPGSIFLIFQALYPYLLYAGAYSNREQAATAQSTGQGKEPFSESANIRLNITGGTNVSFSPSYDYISQVLIPNFAKLGLPPLSVELKRRGWAGGRLVLGGVSFVVTPLKPAHEQKKGQLLDEKDDNHGVAEEIPVKAGNPEIVQEAKSLADLQDGFFPFFPVINIKGLERGDITKIDVTVLAPDTPVHQLQTSSGSSRGVKSKDSRSGKQKSATRQYEEYQSYSDPWAGFDSGTEESEGDDVIEDSLTIRQFFERYAIKSLSRALDSQSAHGINRTASVGGVVTNSAGAGGNNPHESIINLHSSEATSEYSHTYLLLVAHTSTGFRLGRDVLYSSFDSTTEPGPEQAGKDRQRSGTPKKNTRGKNKGEKQRNKKGSTTAILQRFKGMVYRCVEDLIDELQGEESEEDDEVLKLPRIGSPPETSSKKCLDTFMRDQVVIFEALGRLNQRQMQSELPNQEIDNNRAAGEKGLSLHTQTAMWVCEQMLGVKF